MSGQHFLIVHDEPADGMEIEHPDSCPTQLVYDGQHTLYTCDVGRAADEVGLEHWFSRDAAEDWLTEHTPPGRHEIAYWEETVCYPGVREIADFGLRVVEGGAG